MKGTKRSREDGVWARMKEMALAEFAQRVGHIRCASAGVVVEVRLGEREEESEEIGFSWLC